MDFSEKNEMAAKWHKAIETLDIDNEDALFEHAILYANDYAEKVQEYAQVQGYLLELVANIYCNNFWRENKIRRNRDDVEMGTYGCRARIKNNKFEAVWFKNSFLSESALQLVKNPQYTVRSKHFPKGKGLRYPDRTFKHARDWEFPLISMTEDAFSLIRDLRQHANQLRFKAQAYQNRLVKLEQHFDEYIAGEYEDDEDC